jgi:hypothetical protein
MDTYLDTSLASKDNEAIKETLATEETLASKDTFYTGYYKE